METFKDVLCDDDSKVVAINEVNDKVFIDYIQNSKMHTLKFNVNDGAIY
jgi:DNA primase